MPYYIAPPPMNPLSRLLAGILGVLALVGVFFFGIIVLALAVGLGLVAWLVFSLRVWWIRKKFSAAGGGMETEGGREGVRQSGGNEDDITDVEYTVVSRRDEE